MKGAELEAEIDGAESCFSIDLKYGNVECAKLLAYFARSGFARTGIREGVHFFTGKRHSLLVASYFGIFIPLNSELVVFSSVSIFSRSRRSGDFEFGREKISSSSENSDESSNRSTVIQ